MNFNFILSFFVCCLQQFSEMCVFLFFTLPGCLKFFGITFNQVLWKKNEMNILLFTQIKYLKNGICFLLL